MRVRLRTLSKPRTRPSRTVTEVPSQRSDVSHFVPIEPALTEPVAVRQRPPLSETQRRFLRFFFFFFLAALASGRKAAADASAGAAEARAPLPLGQPESLPRLN